VLPLRIFKDVSNLSALGVCACDSLVFNSVAYFLPLYFQLVLGRSPSLSGIYMLAIAVPLATISFASGYLIERTGRYLEVLQSGLALMTLGIGLLVSLNAFLVVVGMGFGPNFGAPLIALQTRIAESDIATGTAAFGFVRMVFGAVGVVVGQVVFQLLVAPLLGEFVELGIPADFARRLARGEAVAMAESIGALPHSQMVAVRTGLARALRGTWVFCTVVSAVGLVVSFGIKRQKLQRATDCRVAVDAAGGSEALGEGRV
jgi:MFS family permease